MSHNDCTRYTVRDHLVSVHEEQEQNVILRVDVVDDFGVDQKDVVFVNSDDVTAAVVVVVSGADPCDWRNMNQMSVDIGRAVGWCHVRDYRADAVVNTKCYRDVTT